LLGWAVEIYCSPFILNNMTKKADWKLKREAQADILLPWAQNKIKKLGYNAKIEGYSVVFRVGVCKVRFYPFTGGIQWQGTPGIKERGMSNLIKLINEHEKTKGTV